MAPTTCDDLWVKVVKAKYKCGRDLVPSLNRAKNGTNFWRGVCHAWQDVVSNFCWRIGDGTCVNCWDDRWVLAVGVLGDLVQRPLTNLEKNLCVSNLRSENGVWDLTPLHGVIPDTVLAKIRSLAVPDQERGRDRVAWSLTADGSFSNASAYMLLLDHNLRSPNGVYKKIWGWKGPERGKLHLWKLSHEALVTNSWRQRRNLVELATCPICENADESVLHVVRDCALMQQVWSNLAEGQMLYPNFFVDNVQDWIVANLIISKKWRGITWNLLFGSAVMLVWQIRNEKVFNQVRSNADQTSAHSIHQAHSILKSIEVHSALKEVRNPFPVDSNLGWKPPDTGWFKVNSDGAVTNFGTKAGCGGVLRDEDGRFIFGFAAGLGSCSITQAELWTILIGLKQIKERGLQKIRVDSDSMTAVRLINEGCSLLHPSANLVFEIRKLLGDDQIVVHHSYRETNQVADGLAKHGMELSSELELFEFLPSFVSAAFAADFVGTVFPRGY